MVMALLFVGGVMNLAWIAGLSILMLLEKVTSVGRTIARVAGLALIVAGLVLAIWRFTVTMNVFFRATSVAVLACVLAGAPRLNATSYPPVTFDELVTRADVIFIGDVVDVRPFTLSTREGEIIKTRVVFRVADPLWGTKSTLETFDFLGGEIDGVAMRVAEMPRFAIGDRRVVFARRGRSINPIVGFTQGLMRVDRDGAGVERVSAMRLTDLRVRIAGAIAELKK